MVKKGPKPKKIIDETWRPNLAYAIGLIATDGCLSHDGLLIDLTSKDREQLLNFSKCLGVNFNIGTKKNSSGQECLRIQFKNRFFYDFLLSIGLTPKKSLTMGVLDIPDKYFFDFLRGCFDGDGSFYSYWDKRWRSSFMFYIEFISASKKHIDWLRKELKDRLNIFGHMVKDGKNSTYQLKYAKKESLEIIKKIYYDREVICLTRKRLKIEKALKINHKQQQTYS
ncbi:MAG TPA: LAGLIDADG family homing endonuclease [Candidatus Paceibacterota bacterium]|nr:LAGLIDADG family homing endonuclease [Candidatus Paceibacterota bacterium]